MQDPGARPVLFTLENPTVVADGDGGYSNGYTALSPAQAWGSLQPVSQRILEKLIANTTVAQASHVVQMRYHPDLNSKTRMTWTDRQARTHRANVTWFQDPDGRGAELTVLCLEVVA